MKMELKHHCTSFKADKFSPKANKTDYILFINEGKIVFDIPRHVYMINQ